MLMGSSSVYSLCVLMLVICSALQKSHHGLGLLNISFVYVFLFPSLCLDTWPGAIPGRGARVQCSCQGIGNERLVAE